MCGAISEMLQRLGGYRGLTHGELLVECNMSCVGPVFEILQGMEGGWVVIEASHMMGYGLNVTFNVLNSDTLLNKKS